MGCLEYGMTSILLTNWIAANCSFEAGTSPKDEHHDHAGRHAGGAGVYV